MDVSMGVCALSFNYPLLMSHCNDDDDDDDVDDGCGGRCMIVVDVPMMIFHINLYYITLNLITLISVKQIRGFHHD
jgi:hypothetical protein